MAGAPSMQDAMCAVIYFNVVAHLIDIKIWEASITIQVADLKMRPIVLDNRSLIVGSAYFENYSLFQIRI